VRAAKAVIADDARDLAIVLVLGDAGLRREELGGLTRAPRLRSPRREGRHDKPLEPRNTHARPDWPGRGAAVFAAVASDRPATRF
jgi:hypothetical protein